MTQEEKELLLKDLCARWPYGVQVEYGCKHEGKDLGERKEKLTGRMLDSYFQGIQIGMSEVYSLRPYLRPMSSMTEEEGKEYITLLANTQESTHYIPDEKPMVEFVDWLNKKMFDYRGLITMGLALEAPKNMYKMEE